VACTVTSVVTYLLCSIFVTQQWTKAPANEKLCTVISKTYEVEDGDQHREEQDLEQGAYRQEVVPGPRASFIGRMFGRNPVVNIAPESSLEEEEVDDERKKEQRTRLGTDFTVETSVSDSNASSSEGMARKSSHDLLPSLQSEAIPEASENDHDETSCNDGVDVIEDIVRTDMQTEVPE
jgi:hypothetical protein